MINNKNEVFLIGCHLHNDYINEDILVIVHRHIILRMTFIRVSTSSVTL